MQVQVVATNLGQREGSLFGLLVRAAMLFAGSPESGAEVIVHLASSPEVAGVTGGYFEGGRLAKPSRAAQDDEVARRLWDESARLAGMAD